jgi:hypothetical protein
LLPSRRIPELPHQEIVTEFNATFGTACRLTSNRRKSMQARWRDEHWRNHWREALQRAGPSAFLRGANDRGWVIDLEFFLRPDTVTKILEGKYDNRNRPDKSANSAAAREQRNAEAFAAVLGQSDCTSDPEALQHETDG